MRHAYRVQAWAGFAPDESAETQLASPQVFQGVYGKGLTP